jgi:Vacuolar protein sorting protein 36 Vps36.
MRGECALSVLKIWLSPSFMIHRFCARLLCSFADTKPPVSLSSKYKLPNHQNGQIYLTSHRICYIDKAEPRKYSVALDLKDIERYEFYVCLKILPKTLLTLYRANLCSSGRIPQVFS